MNEFRVLNFKEYIYQSVFWSRKVFETIQLNYNRQCQYISKVFRYYVMYTFSAIYHPI